MTGRFEITDTPIAGLRVLRRILVEDDRGWLERLYDATELGLLLDNRAVGQVNRTLTRRRGTVRGMHYQRAPSLEAKLVSCLRGTIFDVAIDLRRGSPTFLHWHGERLDGTSGRSLLIPEGFAHGFETLTDDCELLYVHTGPHDRNAEGAIHPLEPRVGIVWPLPIDHLSPRDSSHPPLPATFEGLAQ